jgi:GT2 family glycosyltransferase
MMSPASSDRALSVVMPVHNALPHLDAAVRSILEQTHRDFEFVILDDASTDGSTERLKEWAAKDTRIRLHLGKKNMGPAASSNLVVREAKGRLIARMDADDISYPDRLRRQLEILRAYPEAGLVGSLCDVIDENGRKVRGPDPWRLRHSGWFAPFPHGSIMYRRELFDRAGGYREQCVYWEDLDLFLRIASFAKVLTITEPLYQHRHSHGSTRLDSKQPLRRGARSRLGLRRSALRTDRSAEGGPASLQGARIDRAVVRPSSKAAPAAASAGEASAGPENDSCSWLGGTGSAESRRSSPGAERRRMEQEFRKPSRCRQGRGRMVPAAPLSRQGPRRARTHAE